MRYAMLGAVFRQGIELHFGDRIGDVVDIDRRRIVVRDGLGRGYPPGLAPS